MAVERFTLQCDERKDADIIDYLVRHKFAADTSMNAAMKRAIRAQMKGEEDG